MSGPRERPPAAVLLMLLAAGLGAACAPRPPELPPAAAPAAEARIARAERLLHGLMLQAPELGRHFEIDERGIGIYATARDRRRGRAEHRLYWEEVPVFRRLVHGVGAEELLARYLAKGEGPYPDSLARALPLVPEPFRPGEDPERPLAGLRVALDPGHLGGEQAQARLERRAVDLPADPAAGRPETISFNEGTLAMGTALLLAEKLRTAGAEVLLTREGAGRGAAGLTFDGWLAEHYPAALEAYFARRGMGWWARRKWRRGAGRDRIFHRVFKREDFRLRAAKVNAFRPHLTLILHLNVDGKLWRAGRLQAPGERNYHLAFVPGSYLAGELPSPEHRLQLLARLVGEDMERSITFSGAVVRGLVRRTGVPALTPTEADGEGYLAASIATAEPGVWARNLALTRQIYGVLCFGESLFQDSRAEIQALNRRDLEIGGLRTSSRLRDVAEGYYEAILEYATSGTGPDRT